MDHPPNPTTIPDKPNIRQPIRRKPTGSPKSIPSTKETPKAIVNNEQRVEPAPSPVVESPKSKKEAYDPNRFKQIHFVHIPKCGGTTMTAVLRQILCQFDSETNSDCCLNPGFCDWHAHRRCESIKGCINHFPNRKLIYKQVPSFVVFREPISRIFSAWFYRGHSPNLDFFQVRPEFKLISQGKLPRVTFEEYIEMPEYQNIQTRMLGADSFPYRNITITNKVFQDALDALDHFYFVGLQEEFEISAKAFAREIIQDDSKISITKERGQDSKKLIDEKKKLKSDRRIVDRLHQVNDYDLRLYQRAVERFCEGLEKYPDLLQQVRENGKVHCPQ